MSKNNTLGIKKFKKQYNALSNDIQQAMAILHAVGQSAGDNGQEDLASRAEESLNLYYSLYTGQSFKP